VAEPAESSKLFADIATWVGIFDSWKKEKVFFFFSLTKTKKKDSESRHEQISIFRLWT
jgi:hypothetical protein